MSTGFRSRRGAGFLLSCLTLSAAAQVQNDEPDEIVVTGVPRDRAASELAQPVAVVGGEELDRSRAGTLGETLAGQLGVSSSSFGAGASRPIIRGLAGARVQMLEDGIDSMDAAIVSDDHAVTVEPLAAEQIEIFRGPTTLLYGSGAVGGVVNTVTARIPAAAPASGLEGAFELRADTAAAARGAAARLDGGADRFAWHFDASRRVSDDYAIPGFAHADAESAGGEEPFGRLPNSAAESTSGAVGASWLGDTAVLGIGFNAFDTVYGVPGHWHEHENGLEPHEDGGENEVPVRIDLEQRRLDLRGGFRALRGPIEAVDVRLAVNDYRHVELAGAESGTRFTNEASALRVELLQRAAGAWSGAFGLQANRREFAAVGAEAFVPPVDSETAGLFVVEQVALPKWELTLGARAEWAEHTPSNGTARFADGAASASFGAVRPSAAGLSFAATLARSERLPVPEELYSAGPHLASRMVQVGDAALRSEIASHVDLGIRGGGRRRDWSVTAFRTRYADFIYLADTGGVDAEADLPIFRYAQADAELTGIEAEMLVPLRDDGQRAAELRLFSDYVRGRLVSGGPLPRLPPLRVGARLEYRTERLLVGFESTRYAGQDRAAPFERATPGYTLVGADALWRLRAIAAMELELFANASNLGDAEARKHTSLVKDVAPLPGRNFTVGIRSRF